LLQASLARRKNAASGAPTKTARSGVELSVVMVVRNGRKYLPAALSCVRRQTFRPAEILAVVAASEDGSEDYLRSQTDVRFMAQTGTGLAAARNQGIEAARCDLIAFLDCDDLWHPEKLASQVAALSLLKDRGYSITSFVRVSDRGDAAATTRRVGGDGARIGFTPSALVVHRAAVREIGRFDPDLGIGCDSDWFFRARQQRVPCAVASQVLLYKRIHERNLSRTPATNRESMFKVIAKSRGLGVSDGKPDQAD
jgi:glycosyltransferase involved in cell wall biosynthesis